LHRRLRKRGHTDDNVGFAPRASIGMDRRRTRIFIAGAHARV
jgi:hypothetical protein